MSNAWATYLKVADNPSKEELIRDVANSTQVHLVKDGDLFGGLSLLDGPASYQLVGEVMAHQGA